MDDWIHEYEQRKVDDDNSFSIMHFGLVVLRRVLLSIYYYVINDYFFVAFYVINSYDKVNM